MIAYLFQDADVPAGFRFPEAFVDLVSQEETPYHEPWWFLSEFPDSARKWLSMLRESFPDRSLIPFAKNDIYPEVACFDGTDHSGDPIVYYVNADAPSGREIGGKVKNFAEWLDRTKEESAEWRAQRSGRSASGNQIPENGGDMQPAAPAVPKT